MEYKDIKDIDPWDAAKWRTEFETCHVAVLAAQVFLKLLQEAFLSLSMLNLMIVDECHHALQPLHPYHKIVAEIQRCPEDGRPRILGLTASILNGQQEPHALEEQINRLETLLLSTARIATNLLGVSKYGTRPREAVITCKEYEDCVELVEKLSNLLMDGLNQLDQFSYAMKAKDLDGELVESPRDPVLPARQALNECMSALLTIGPLGVKILIPMLIREVLKLEKHEFLDLHLLFLHHAMTHLRMVERICDNAMRDGGNVYDLKFVTPKVRRLLEVLKEFKPKEENLEGKSQQSAQERANRYAARRQAHKSHKGMHKK